MMNRTLRLAVVGVSATALLGLAACGGGEDTYAETEAEAGAATDAGVDAMAETETTDGTIVEVASGNSDFSTLVSAVQTAGLAETLSGEGPYTVFAPNNAAFEEVPAAERDALMQADRREDLTGILTYHVVAGRLTAADVAAALQAGGGSTTLTTVEGGTLTVRDAGGGRITITDEAGNTATVVSTDVMASNGVIHVIDGVLMPN